MSDPARDRRRMPQRRLPPLKHRPVVQFFQTIAQIGGVLASAGISLAIFSSSSPDLRLILSVVIVIIGGGLMWWALTHLFRYPNAEVDAEDDLDEACEVGI
ncbi:hypothetical protein [Microbacterium lacticum]|uniref:hypothetical protein n=1 Tax=Microbacterium lacticum TaxID=33885 RepID=UPI001F58998A|nr:hypothetical protein [Microbacterium lacticum]